MFGLGMCQQVVVQWTVFFYAPPDRAAAYLLVGSIGTAMVIGRLIDGLADPVVAFFSDRAGLRMGRRRPFILLGTPLMILAFLLLWLPPASGISPANFTWAALMLALFFVAYSIILVPYLALLPDIAPTETRRVRLWALQGIFFGAGAAFAFLITTLLVPVLGLFRLSVLLAPAAVLAILWTAYRASERTPGRGAASSVNWLTAWSTVIRDRMFMLWIAVQGLNRGALIVIIMLFPYLLLTILGIESPGDISPLAVLVAVGGAAVSGTAAYRGIQSRGLDAAYGRNLVVAGLTIAAGGFVALDPINIMPQVQAALVFACAAGPLGIILLLPNAVIADLARRRRSQRGEESEAMLYAVQGIVVKICMAGGSAVVGFLLHTFGGDFARPLGIRLSLLAAGAVLLLSYLVYRAHLLSKKHANENT